MRSPSGYIVLASAGSGKSTWIAQEVRDRPTERALVATYTTTNSGRVEERFWKEAGRLPEWVRVRTWFTFLLEDLVRPFQNVTGWETRIAGIHLAAGISAKYQSKKDWSYWFNSSGSIYNDKISAFAVWCDDASGGAVLRRLVRLYDHIYIDEVQDMAGHDLDLLERLIKKGVQVTMVGDPRQGTYSTNMARRNAKFRGESIREKFEEWKRRKLCSIIEHSHSFRCRPEICRLADHLFPDYPRIVSKNGDATEHDGVYLVRSEHAHHYIGKFRPAVLRWDRRERCLGYDATNFGESKGQEYERVLVFPTGPIGQWIASGNASKVEKSLAKLYVAITRARQSLGFVYNGTVGLGDLIQGYWTP